MNRVRLRRLLREALNEMDVSHYDRMPDSAMDRMIPAGNLEEILRTDGLAEFKDELAFHCEILEQGDEPYHIMEPAEYEYISAAIGDFADDGDMDFAEWLNRSHFDNVLVGETDEPNFVRWTMR